LPRWWIGVLRVKALGYDRPVTTRVLILGAGFGGLELSTMLSEALGDGVEVTLIDKNDSFVFGYSKLDVMFGRTMPEAYASPTARSPSREFAFCRRPSPRSTPRRRGPTPTSPSTTPTSSSWR
jgi:sulfide:quinone oxidoreductase